jgi:hypothetical protein
VKIRKALRCSAIVSPGEYTITRWDGERCEETRPYRLIKCEACGASFCLSLHWHKHLDSVPLDHFEKATE